MFHISNWRGLELFWGGWAQKSPPWPRDCSRANTVFRVYMSYRAFSPSGLIFAAFFMQRAQLHHENHRTTFECSIKICPTRLKSGLRNATEQSRYRRSVDLPNDCMAGTSRSFQCTRDDDRSASTWISTRAHHALHLGCNFATAAIFEHSIGKSNFHVREYLEQHNEFKGCG